MLLPAETDAVVPLELADPDSQGWLEMIEAVVAGDNVEHQGAIATTGATLVPAGTRLAAPPRRSRSISRRAYRSAKRRRRSTTGWPGSACRLRSTALSRGRPGRFSNRSHINPC